MGYIKGDWVRFYNAGVQLELEMEVTINATADTIETTDKDSAGWKTYLIGDKGWTVSGSGNWDPARTENADSTFTDFNTGTAVAIDVGTTQGAKFYSGSGLITGWSITGPRNGLSTFTFEVQGTSTLTAATKYT